VTNEDIRWLLALTGDRVRAAMSSTYRGLGIDDDLVQRCNRSIERALGGGGQLTRDELRQVLEQDGLDGNSGQRMSHLMMRAELDGLVCSGPRKGKQFTYMLLEERVPAGLVLSREEALAELAGRFFLSRGPATVQDFARWSGLTVTEARKGLEAVKNRLVEVHGEGQLFWMPANTDPSDEAGPVTHLLSVYDEYLSGYANRSAMLEPGYLEPLRAQGNGLVNVIVVDGQVVGAWRRTERKNAFAIELVPFRHLEEKEREAVKAAAQRYAAFFGKEVVEYGDGDVHHR
jgi:hypothetical protein